LPFNELRFARGGVAGLVGVAVAGGLTHSGGNIWQVRQNNIGGLVITAHSAIAFAHDSGGLAIRMMDFGGSGGPALPVAIRCFSQHFW